MKTEREIQLEIAGNCAKLWNFLLDNNETFSAYALTENGAFRVLNAEKPWATVKKSYGNMELTTLADLKD